MDSELNRIRLALGRSMIAQARFGEVMAIARRVSQSGQWKDAMQAELLWGTALSLEGSDLEAAAEHLKAAEELCRSEEGTQARKDSASLSMINFELGSVLAQQGDLPQAIAFYQKALAAASESDDTLENRILAYNNLGYHMHLLGDPSAYEFALKGLNLSEEKGFLGLQPYLLSTLGEIALDQQNLEEAERFFSKGLAIAERLAMPERIAGLTANLGLVALQRGNIPLAIHHLSSALGKADSLGTRHLAAQIRLWLAPLLPVKEGRIQLAEARSFAQSSGRTWLLENAIRLEAELAAKTNFENR
jgi:tetratricopeptide (TPR) repeat protein